VNELTITRLPFGDALANMQHRATVPRASPDAQKSLQRFELLNVFLLKSGVIQGSIQHCLISQRGAGQLASAIGLMARAMRLHSCISLRAG
jgi:hypothetical protein